MEETKKHGESAATPFFNQKSEINNQQFEFQK